MILMYHKIDLQSPTMWCVDVDTFWRQMEQLTRYDVVPLRDYDPDNPRHAVITFDGVYENVYHYALPVLRWFGYPFELFVIGDLIGRDNRFDQAVEPPAIFANRDQLQACVRAGGRLQWHSRTHSDLASLGDDDLRRELLVPDEIRVLDPDGFRWFAYPHGNVEGRVVELVQLMFDGAVACDRSALVDHYQLSRVTVTNATSFAKSTVSLIIANYNYGRFAAEAIESALAQTVAPKEIVFIDDCSQDNSLEVASRYKEKMKIVRNDRNLGIVDNFNKAVSLTTGDYICFLGADNRFRSDYVERCQRLLDQHPEVGIVYTDMVLFGPRAEVLALRVGAEALPSADRMFVWRCPDFTEESARRLASSNFIHGSSMYRREAFVQAGGYTKSHLPEDHQLFFRMIQKGWKALRCPERLLEYRQHSTDQANTQLNCALELAHAHQEIKALVEENLRLKATLNGIYASFSWEVLDVCRRVKGRLAPEGSVRRTFYLWIVHAVRLVSYEGRKRFIKKVTDKVIKLVCPQVTTVKERNPVRWNVTGTVNQHPTVEVVIVTWNSSASIRLCLESVRASDYPIDKIVVRVVDNHSADGTIRLVEEMKGQLPSIEIIQNSGNVGFGRGVNEGLARATAKYVLLLNPDAELRSDCLRKLVECALLTEGEGFGAWEARQQPFEHPKLYDPVTLDTEWVSGACCLLLRVAFERVGGFDPNIFLYAEDVDLSWRLRETGYRLHYVPKAVVVHHTYSDEGAIKPTQFTNSVISNGILRHKYGSLRNMAMWYLRFAKLLISPPNVPSSRSALLKGGVLASGKIFKTLVGRFSSRASVYHVIPRFKGWDYEVRRVGAFYRIKACKEMPLVSVIIRTMERPSHLREALQSVRNQTYPNLEVIVVDDGAVKFRKVLQEFADLVIQFIDPEEHLGRCRAGNVGLKRAKGKYVNFLDDDDLLFADHVETLVGELEANGECAAAYSTGFQVETEWKSFDPLQYEEGDYEVLHQQPFDRSLLKTQNYIPINCMMFSRVLYERHGGFDEALPMLEDWDLWNRYAEHTDFIFIPKTTCLYRVPKSLKRAAQRQQALDEAYPVVMRKFSPNHYLDSVRHSCPGR